MDRHRSVRSSADYGQAHDYDIFSQETPYPLTAPSLSTPRVGLQDLDLNSQADCFPHMDSYTEILQLEEGRGEPWEPPLPPRSGQPPRQGGGGRGPGRGACQAAGGQGHRNSRAAAGRMPQGSAPPAQLNRPGRSLSSSSTMLQPRALSADGYLTNTLTQEVDDDLELLHQQNVTLSTSGKGVSKRGSNYTGLEDVQLCKSWINITYDPITGNDQSRNTYWERITNDFHSNRDFDSDRTPNSLEHRFGTILKECMKFQGYYEEVQRRHPSGVPYQEHLREAHARYARSANGKKFQFEECWLTMRHTEKFESAIEANKRPTKSRDINLSVSSQQDNDSTAQGQSSASNPSAKTARPPGRRQSKEKLKRNEGEDEYKDMMKNLLVMKTEEHTMKKQRWEKELMLEERKLKMEEDRLLWDMEQKVMFCDVNNLDNEQRVYVKAKRAKLAKAASASLGETASGESVV